MHVQIIQVPYDSGHRALRMGAGPEHFIKSGISRLFQDKGFKVQVEAIQIETAFRTEITTAVELCSALASRVTDAQLRQSFPLVLSGNCNSALGTLAGLDQPNLGMIWLDAHGDFNTPETTESGYFDGMGMAIAAGLCWKKLATNIPRFSPVAASDIIHVGGRDFDLDEEELMQDAGIRVVRASEIKRTSVQDALLPALTALSHRTKKIYLHIDLDILDPEKTPANQYAARVPNGLTVEEVEGTITTIAERFEISAAAIASYDPAYDREGETLRAGVRIIDQILSTLSNDL